MIKQILAGKSLPRILMNQEIERYTKKNPLHGKVIDLGSKSNEMSYNRYLNREENCKITYTDLNPISDNVKKVDLEEKFPIDDETFDGALCLNTLEHIFNYENIVSESARIMKHGGVFIGATPFLVPYHPDPEDYFRYTWTALEKIFKKAGFEKLHLEPLGIGPFSAGMYHFIMSLPKWMRPFGIYKMVIFDKIINFFTRGRNGAEKYPLMYFFVFKKI